MNPKDLLLQISTLLGQRRLDSFSEKRFIKDLEAVQQRLYKNEYRLGGFSMNVFDVPDRTREFFIYLEFYCYLGRTWQSFLNYIDLNKYDVVADLCPGYTPKVELALFYMSYKEKVVMLDKDSKSTRQLENFMKLFAPQFTMERRSIDLFGRFRQEYPVVIGNHIIDDLVIGHYAKKLGIAIDDVYEKEGVLVDIWKHVLEHKSEAKKEVVPLIVRGLKKIVQADGWLFLSQYRSYMERLLSLKEVPYFTKAVLRSVVKQLCTEGFVDHQEIVKKGRRDFRGKFGKGEVFVLKKV